LFAFFGHEDIFMAYFRQENFYKKLGRNSIYWRSGFGSGRFQKSDPDLTQNIFSANFLLEIFWRKFAQKSRVVDPDDFDRIQILTKIRYIFGQVSSGNF
jgi:hypothetical protein